MNLTKLFNLQFLMFAEMAAGYFLCRFHVLKPKDRSVFSKAVISLFLPANIIASFDTELNGEMLKDFLQIILVGTAVHIFCMILAAFLFQKEEEDRRKVLQFATVCSNAGFLGNAVAEGVYGQMGMLYGQIYLIPVRIVLWSAGVSYFQGKADLKTTMKKILTHPCIIAVGIGLIRMIFQIPIPEMIDGTLVSLGRCSTPLIMVFLGMILAESGFSSMISVTNLKYAFLRLVFIPVCVLVACLLLKIDPLVTGLSVLLSAMPAASTTAVLAEQYHADVSFAADCVVFSTILSIAVLPVWTIILNAVC